MFQFSLLSLSYQGWGEERGGIWMWSCCAKERTTGARMIIDSGRGGGMEGMRLFVSCDCSQKRSAQQQSERAECFFLVDLVG